MVALWGMGRVGWTRRNSDFLLYTYVDREFLMGLWVIFTCSGFLVIF